MHSRCGGRERQTRRRASTDITWKKVIPISTPHWSGNSETETCTFWFASQADFPSPRSDGPMSWIVWGGVRPRFLPRVVTVQKVPFEPKMKISRLSFTKVSIHLWRSQVTPSPGNWWCRVDPPEANWVSREWSLFEQRLPDEGLSINSATEFLRRVAGISVSSAPYQVEPRPDEHGLIVPGCKTWLSRCRGGRSIF